MKTLAWRKVPKWRRDPFILGSYRRTKADVWEILASLTYLHNETVNVYTHLVGATLLPLAATTVMRMLSQPQFINVSETDYTMFRIFFCSAEFCLICSTMYHLASPYSRKVERFWHRMDLLGIVIATAGTFIPSIYYIFFCEAAVQRLHWCIVSHSEWITAPYLASVRPSLQSNMLRLGYNPRGRDRYAGVLASVWNVTLAGGESGHVCSLRHLCIHPLTARGVPAWSRVYASAFGHEVVYTGTCDIWRRSHCICGMFLILACIVGWSNMI